MKTFVLVFVKTQYSLSLIHIVLAQNGLLESVLLKVLKLNPGKQGKKGRVYVFVTRYVCICVCVHGDKAYEKGKMLDDTKSLPFIPI